MSDSQVAQVKSGLTALRKQVANNLEKQNVAKDDLKLVLGALDDVIDVVEKTVEAKNSNAALAAILDPGPLPSWPAQQLPTAPSWKRP